MKQIKTAWSCAAIAFFHLGTANVVHSEPSPDKQKSIESVPQKEENSVWGQEAAGFKLAIKPNKETYAVGENVALRFVLKNVSEHTIKLMNGGGDELTYNLEITQPNGEQSSLTELGKNARRGAGENGIVHLSLEPSDERKSLLQSVSAYFDLTQPGEYSLQLSRQVPSLEDPTKEITLASNVVKITVGEPEETDEDDSVATTDDKPKD